MAQIPLRARDGSIRAYALVDDADFEWLNQWRWWLNGRGYAVRDTSRSTRGTGRRKVVMHREILGLPRGDRRQGEHISRDPLDCRRKNLRVAARGQLDNQQNRGLDSNNTSGYRGVTWSKASGKWKAQCTLSGRNHHLGYFDTAEAAGAVAAAFRAERMPFSQEAAA